MTKETNAQYHADLTHVGSTMLKTYRKSPARFHGLYVAGTIEPDPPAPAMVLGSLTHCLLLEPETFEHVFLVAKGCKVRRGKEWERIKAIAETEGKTPVFQAQLDHADAMARAVRANPVAAKLLRAEGAVVEQPIRWQDDSGLKLKCKPDLLIDDGDFRRELGLDCVLCCDLKTSETPRPEQFWWAAQKWGSLPQAALYVDGCRSVRDDDRPVRFVFIVVGKEAPFDVYTYYVESSDLEDARTANVDTICRLARSLETGVWMAPGQDELLPLQPPSYRRR